jgi:hypothetical protein
VPARYIHTQERVFHTRCSGQKGPWRASPESWNASENGGEVRFWLGLMERSRSDFEKANLQAYIDPAGEAMKEVIHGRGKQEETIHCSYCFLRVR